MVIYVRLYSFNSIIILSHKNVTEKRIIKELLPINIDINASFVFNTTQNCRNRNTAIEYTGKNYYADHIGEFKTMK